MANILPDTIDFKAYMRDTEARVKVRPASAFAADLRELFEPPVRGGKRKPHMFSTKLRDAIEFRPGEVTCWAGYSGHRKSMFTGQVALDLCVQDQRVMMASFEMRPANTLQRMCRQAAAISQPQRWFVDAFSKWTDSRLWLFDHMGRISGAECGAVCRYFAEELDGQHVFIDSMMMVCNSEEHLDEQKQFMTDLVRLAQETGLHVHLVAHCRKPQTGEDKPPTKYDLRGSAAISDQSHNVITVWANKAKRAALDKDPSDEEQLQKPDALISIEKQRNGEREGRYSMWFADGSLRFSDSRMCPVEPYVLEDIAS
jgi:twinkle protein